MNLLYRIRQRRSNEVASWLEGDPILEQNIMVVDTIEDFKDIIKKMYDNKIAFRNSKSLKEGDLYVTIIAKEAYNAEEYITVLDYKCAKCGREFKACPREDLTLSSWQLSDLNRANQPKYEQEVTDLQNMHFCCRDCLEKYFRTKLEEYRQDAFDKNLASNEFITTSSFSSTDGFIYMITKKSTGEFYVGQTKWCPIFRWGQHLRTDRFKLENITDYKFEVLETCANSTDVLNARESWWIHKKYEENPEKSLNIQMPKLQGEEKHD